MIRGINTVGHGNETIACYAAVVAPETRCVTHGGKSVICDRVLRFYDASTALKSHFPIPECEKVSLQKQNNNILKLVVGDNDVYNIFAPQGKRLDIKWGDFSSLESRTSLELNTKINQYVMALLKKKV